MARARLCVGVRPARHARTGFTLVELLVAIAIIMVLVAIAAPTVRTAREHAGAAVCMNNERRLWDGFVLFAAEHDDRLPGGLLDFWTNGRSDHNPEHWDWLSGAVPQWGNVFWGSFERE